MTTREAAQQEAEKDTQKAPRQLLVDIHDKALDTYGGEKQISAVLARFSALLVVLSEQADKATQDNLAMQRKLVRLTWGLFWLTVVLGGIALAQLCMMFK